LSVIAESLILRAKPPDGEMKNEFLFCTAEPELRMDPDSSGGIPIGQQTTPRQNSTRDVDSVG
jgi:hypothetical protein